LRSLTSNWSDAPIYTVFD